MSTPEIEPQASFSESRRSFITKSAATCGALLLGGYTVAFGRGAGREILDNRGRDQARELFESGIERHWRKVGIFPGIVQIDPSAHIADSMFGPGEPLVEQQDVDGFLIAQQPFGVKRTLLRNIADYSQDVQNKVNRILPEMSDGLMAFWLPGQTELSYVDIKQESGRVTALSDGNTTNHGVLMDKADIEGRELRGDQIFPYRQRSDVQFAPEDSIRQEIDALREAAYAFDSEAAGYDEAAHDAAWAEYRAVDAEARADMENYEAVSLYKVFGHSYYAASPAHVAGDAWWPGFYQPAEEAFPEV